MHRTQRQAARSIGARRPRFGALFANLGILEIIAIIGIIATQPLACSSEIGGTGGQPAETISRCELHFVPVAGGDTVVASFSDPDGDGGVSGMATPINLANNVEYLLEIRVYDELVEPAQELTQEIEREAEEHLLLIAGAGVEGPASTSAVALVTHTYNDAESDYGDNATGADLPVGLVNTIFPFAPGESELRVMLRHLPELNGSAQKTMDLPGELAAGRPLPGEADLDVTFVLNVN